MNLKNLNTSFGYIKFIRTNTHRLRRILNLQYVLIWQFIKNTVGVRFVLLFLQRSMNYGSSF